MEDILKYENRHQLYSFLIEDFGLTKIDDHYDPKAFGNFCVTLAAKDFLLSYINDRSFLTIDIASKLEPKQGFSLSFVRDYLYNPENINSNEKADNTTRINQLNDFLKKDFFQISQLFNSQNYYSTKKQINKLLMKQFIKRNPGQVE